MEFKMRAFKKPEFESLIKQITTDNKIGFGMLTFNYDGDDVTAIVQDSVIEKLSAEELSALKAIS